MFIIIIIFIIITSLLLSLSLLLLHIFLDLTSYVGALPYFERQTDVITLR